MNRCEEAMGTNVQDQLAVFLSSLCLVHCLAMPIALGMLPASLLWLESELVHGLLVLLAIPVSGFAIFAGLGEVDERKFVAGASTGLLLLVLALTVESLHDYEIALTTIGATLLACAHLSRWVRRARGQTKQRE